MAQRAQSTEGAKLQPRAVPLSGEAGGEAATLMDAVTEG